jgi:stage V sporulation protein AC
MASLWYKNNLMNMGISEKNAGIFVTISLVFLAQLLTGLGVFDVIAKFAGAGVIVPITGFANSMVAPALEYKKEGPVLGVGSKIFSVAGPVLVCGISSATVVGIIYWLTERF